MYDPSLLHLLMGNIAAMSAVCCCDFDRMHAWVWRGAQVLKDKVAKGEFGRKSGKGFYHWDGDKIGAPVE